MRYVVEKVAKQPALRRVKDTLRNRYVKQPHGPDLWTAEAAQAKALELNAAVLAAQQDPTRLNKQENKNGQRS